MGWPQITYIVLIAMSGGLTLAKDGEPKGNYSFGGWFVSALIVLGLLYAGGFFG